ncbi:MAG: SpoIIE family protein phosphatase [Proteobacteria bacterium]|uniref:SpoIIE family protein phosphatase n=1 Tax=Candidatus Avisuccinivibrio stercorigallinarum TaxID=2840704 RepID=A0A9D9D9P5_9GAMM|nr:SpoIIE family protein phosphatase [Candidatus Avisuccinivibrio stercorigallinarum]
MNRSKLIPACGAAALLILGTAFAAWLNYCAAPAVLSQTQQGLFTSKVRDLGSLLDLKAQELTAQYRTAIKTKSAELAALQQSFSASETELADNLAQALQSVEFLAPDFERALTGSGQSYTRLTLKAAEHGALLISSDQKSGLIYAPESLKPLLQLKSLSGTSLKDSLDSAAAGAGDSLRLEDENSVYCVRLFSFAGMNHALIFAVNKPDFPSELASVLSACATAAEGHDPNLTLLELYYNEQDLFTAHITPADDPAQAHEAKQDNPAQSADSTVKLSAEVQLDALPFTLRADGRALAIDLKDTALSVFALTLIASAVLYLLLRALNRSIGAQKGTANGKATGERPAAAENQDAAGTEPDFALQLPGSRVKQVLDALQPAQNPEHNDGLQLAFKHQTASPDSAAEGSAEFSNESVQQALTELNQRLAASEESALKAVKDNAEARAARVLQLALLPAAKSVPATEFLDIAALQQPCHTRQSTVYDLFRLDENNIAFLVGSAKGSGLKASVSAALCAIALRQALKESQHTAKALTAVNAGQLRHQCLPADFICCILNEKTGNFVLSSAGACCALHLTPQERERLNADSAPLGTAEDSQYVQQKGILVPGDVLLLLSPELATLSTEDGQSFEALLSAQPEFFAQGCDNILRFVSSEAGRIFANQGLSTDSACIALKQLQIHF